MDWSDIGDWMPFYYVWVDEAGRVEHDARRRFDRYRQLRMYDKDSHRQKGREIVDCRFGLAPEALTDLLDEKQKADAERSWLLGLGLDLPHWPPNDLEALAMRAAKLFERVGHLELSVRSSNCLKNDCGAYSLPGVDLDRAIGRKTGEHLAIIEMVETGSIDEPPSFSTDTSVEH